MCFEAHLSAPEGTSRRSTGANGVDWKESKGGGILKESQVGGWLAVYLLFLLSTLLFEETKH